MDLNYYALQQNKAAFIPSISAKVQQIPLCHTACSILILCLNLVQHVETFQSGK